jgi:hypothetical protein
LTEADVAEIEAAAAQPTWKGSAIRRTSWHPCGETLQTKEFDEEGSNSRDVGWWFNADIGCSRPSTGPQGDLIWTGCD